MRNRLLPLAMPLLLAACAVTPPAPAIVVAPHPEIARPAAASSPPVMLPVQVGERLRLTLKSGKVLYMPVAAIRDGQLVGPMGQTLPLSEVAKVEVLRDLPDRPRQWWPVAVSPIASVGPVEIGSAFRPSAPPGNGQTTPLPPLSAAGGGANAVGLAPAAGTAAGSAPAAAGGLGGGAGSAGAGGLGSGGLGGGAMGSLGGIGGGGLGGFSLGGLGGGGGGGLPLALTLPGLLLGLWRSRRRG